MNERRHRSAAEHVPSIGFTHPQPVLPRYSPSPSISTSSPLSGSGPKSSGDSPSSRHPLTRPLSPDLPTRDALYVFANFSSYMQSPLEGVTGVRSTEDFKDTIRLLDYARVRAYPLEPSLSTSADSHVSILHLKYRFRSPSRLARHGPTAAHSGPTPQPFSTLHDPVIKIDYRDNGVFEPLPAAALFSHIAKACQPPPRSIVFAHVGSKVIHSPPIYVFSPAEVRIRDQRPLHLALGHAIPISMYAWPANKDPSSPTRHRSTSRRGSTDHHFRRDMQISPIEPIHPSGDLLNPAAKVQIPRTPSTTSLHTQMTVPRPDRPSEPIASLTIYTTPSSSEESGSTQAPRQADRIPLWALAPGVGILHGSTWRGLSIHLADFSAINLTHAAAQGSNNNQGAKIVAASDLGFRTSPMDMGSLLHALPPTLVEKSARPATPASHIPLPVPAPRSRPLQSKSQEVGPSSRLLEPTARLSVPHNTRGGHSSGEVLGVGVQQLQSGLSRGWPGQRPTEGLAGWRRGRKETMEEVLEDFGLYQHLPVAAGADENGRPSDRLVNNTPPLGLGQPCPPCELLDMLFDDSVEACVEPTTTI